MRGTLGIQNAVDGITRFIPAYAGNTTESAGRCRRETVHPRVCGEHTASMARMLAAGGSSPRMRGTHVTLVVKPLDNRFIPAYAGNTMWSPLTAARPPVHPRVCGEHITELNMSRSDSGSSPRMRGTQVLQYPRIDFLRFIPAYAGNTLKRFRQVFC